MITLMNRKQHSDVNRSVASRARLVITIAVICASRYCVAQTLETTDAIVMPRLLAHRAPEFHMPEPNREIPSSFIDLWIEALAGPEQDLKHDVAMDIRRAHQDRYLDCSPVTESLIKVLQNNDARRSVRVEIARTLIALDARDSAATFKRLLNENSGTQFEMIVEPALARWNDSEMPPIWRQRLADRNPVRYRQRLAIRALAVVQSSASDRALIHDDLRRLITTSRDTTIAIEAATTLGEFKREGLEDLAAQLLLSSNSASRPHSPAGIFLLQHHDSDTSRKILLQVITDGMTIPHMAPNVRQAWKRLLELEVQDLAALAPQVQHHSDSGLRTVAVETFLLFASSQSVDHLGQMLDDRHPDIRLAARQALLQLSETTQLNDAVRLAAMEAIAGSSWMQQEQAIIILTELKHEDAAHRLLELLQSPRAEVMIAAAWGLTRLNVPDSIPSMLEIAKKLDQRVRKGQNENSPESIALAHLLEGLGLARHQPVVPLLKRWIPKKSPQVDIDLTRCSAFWALGLLYEDSKDKSLARQLVARFIDVEDTPLEAAETATIHYVAAISLGRLGAPTALGSLKNFSTPVDGEVAMAAAWAIARITGEAVRPPLPASESGGRWRLSPIGSRLRSANDEASTR